MSKIIQYRRKLYAVTLKENQSMTEHVNNVKTLSEQLEALEDPVRERDLVIVLLSSLPDEYNNLITTLETLKEEKLTWTYVRDRLITEYERKKGEHQPSRPKGPEDALLCGESNKKGKFKFPCHYCGETGHFIIDCQKKKDAENRKREPENERKKKENETASFCNGDDMSKLKVYEDFCPEFALHVSDCEEEKRWLLDSACSKHLTGEKGDLVDCKEIDVKREKSEYVRLADKSIVKAVGRGNLNLYLPDVNGRKTPVTFRDALFVPGMERLILIGQLTKRGGEVGKDLVYHIT